MFVAYFLVLQVHSFLGMPYPGICYLGTRSGSLSGTRVPNDKYLMEIVP